MEEYLKYNLQKVKNKKNIAKRKNKLSYKNNIIQFSLNAINNILINNLNSSTTLGMLNITNNLIAKNKNQTTNTNSYINSINDCLDYKIKGNIYKPSESFFFDLYPKIDNIVKTKKRQKKELKILKFDKEILVSQAKTPTKKISKQFCFDIIDNNNNKKQNIYPDINNSQVEKNKKIISIINYSNRTQSQNFYHKKSKSKLDLTMPSLIENYNNNNYGAIKLHKTILLNCDKKSIKNKFNMNNLSNKISNNNLSYYDLDNNANYTKKDLEFAAKKQIQNSMKNSDNKEKI